MIKTIKIKNFQSHENTTLEFSNGVNVIVGSSDGGKTAIIRALRWAITNRPSGDGVRSWWGGDTSSTVVLDNGTVTRFKGKEERYEVSREDHDTVVLRAFGTSIPAEVSNLFNINEINLQGQLDAPFLLSDSPGAVAAHFNKISKLDKIDSATSAINSWIRELTASSRFKQTELTRLETELTQYDYIDECEVEIEAVETLESVKTNTASSANTLETLLGQLQKVDKQIDNCQSGVLSIEKEVTVTADLIELRAMQDNAHDNLFLLIDSIANVEDEILRLQGLLTLEAHVVHTLTNLGAKGELQLEIIEIKQLLQYINTTERQITQTTQKLEILQKRLFSEMPDICPLCNQPITK